jgi:hypothetical protein
LCLLEFCEPLRFGASFVALAQLLQCARLLIMSSATRIATITAALGSRRRSFSIAPRAV